MALARLWRPCRRAWGSDILSRDKLAATQKFSLLCGYAMGTFYKDSGLTDIHRQHSHVVIDQGLAARAKRTTTIS